VKVYTADGGVPAVAPNVRALRWIIVAAFVALIPHLLIMAWIDRRMSVAELSTRTVEIWSCPQTTPEPDTSTPPGRYRRNAF